MICSYYFQIENSVYQQKLVPVMNGLEEILDCAAIYFDNKTQKTVIETKGMNNKFLNLKIDNAKRFLEANGITYLLTKNSI